MENMEATWLGHSSIRIDVKASTIDKNRGESIIYVDPWKLPPGQPKADIILISHPHPDHASMDDVRHICQENTVIIRPKALWKDLGRSDVLAAVGREGLRDRSLAPRGVKEIGGVKITGIEAYDERGFHPKKAGWLGFIIQVGGERIYYAGDTDLLPLEMSHLGEIDLAILPVGGTYTMGVKEAAEAAAIIRPKAVMPCHYGSEVGTQKDADDFIEMAAELDDLVRSV